jgi:SAM-dependent methyltransferase
MKTEKNYIEINKRAWNKQTACHLLSAFYDNESFIKGRNSLNEIELGLLGNIKGKSVLHLQCHFGQDTISLNRLGALSTGVDLSDKAIEEAKELAHKTNSDSKFICCDIYDLDIYLNEKFDIIYTSYGTIGWLPDLDKWAAIISKFLKPNGKFIFVEFHPVVWMFDDDFKFVKYNYSNTGPIIESENGTYADRDANITNEYVMWNHGISEVINSLIKKDLVVQELNEYDYSPYNCFKETEEFEKNKFRIKHLRNNIPMVYSIVAVKKPTSTNR